MCQLIPTEQAENFPDSVQRIATEICQSILVSDSCQPALTKKYRRLFCFEDVKFLIYHEIMQNLKGAEAGISEVYVENVFHLMRSIPVPQRKNRKLSSSYKLSSGARKCLKYPNMVGFYGKIYMALTKRSVNSRTRKGLLVWLPDRVFGMIPNAELFSDFVFRSFQMGHPYDVLSLNGLFYLMQNHYLEYPEFYAELYKVLRPSVCYSAYRKRFFKILDTFLSSTHLPVYLVAAFAKRLGRLLLIAPMECCQPLLDLISNLVVRHPELKPLLNRQQSADEDPYSAQEADPANCNAMQSSLWEIKTMQSHWYGTISRKAKFLLEREPNIENEIHWPISDELWRAEFDKKYDDVPLTFVEPDRLFSLESFWKP